MDDFDVEFTALHGRAYGVAYKILGDRGDAEDVAQETLARALVGWRRVRSHAGPWVVRVAGNLAIDRARRRSRPSVAPEERCSEIDQERLDLQRALLELSARQREVVVLRYLADLAEADVAIALGCSVGAVKTHTFRGLRALRTALSGSEA